MRRSRKPRHLVAHQPEGRASPVRPARQPTGVSARHLDADALRGFSCKSRPSIALLNIVWLAVTVSTRRRSLVRAQHRPFRQLAGLFGSLCLLSGRFFSRFAHNTRTARSEFGAKRARFRCSRDLARPSATLGRVRARLANAARVSHSGEHLLLEPRNLTSPLQESNMCSCRTRL